jgi:hypothetical protein
MEAMPITVYSGEGFVRCCACGRAPARLETNLSPVTFPPLPRHSYSVLSNVVAGQGHRNPSSVSVELFDSLWVLDELVDPEVEWWLDKIRTRFQYFAKTADTYTHYHTKRYAAVND